MPIGGLNLRSVAPVPPERPRNPSIPEGMARKMDDDDSIAVRMQTTAVIMKSNCRLLIVHMVTLLLARFDLDWPASVCKTMNGIWYQFHVEMIRHEVQQWNLKNTLFRITFNRLLYLTSLSFLVNQVVLSWMKNVMWQLTDGLSLTYAYMSITCLIEKENNLHTHTHKHYTFLVIIPRTNIWKQRKWVRKIIHNSCALLLLLLDGRSAS